MLLNRLFLLLSILFLIPTLSFAQKKKVVDAHAIIYTSDGSVFIGHIVEEDKLNLKLIAVTQDTLNINKAFIKRIRRSDQNILIHSGGKFHFTKGLFYSLQWGGGGSDDGSGTTQIDFIVGNRFDKKVSAGLGVGLNYNYSFFRGVWTNSNFISTYTYGRYYPFDKKVRPFISGKLGWGFPDRNSFGDDHQGGILFQPGIGIHFASRKNSRFLISISQYIQNTKGENVDFDLFNNPVISKYSIWYNRTVFKVAIEWK